MRTDERIVHIRSRVFDLKSELESSAARSWIRPDLHATIKMRLNMIEAELDELLRQVVSGSAQR